MKESYHTLTAFLLLVPLLLIIGCCGDDDGGNVPPRVSITSPTDGASFIVGTPVSFRGSATDSEDGTLTGASLVWTSTLDGGIGTGESFDRNDLTVGTHTIRLTATDSSGASASDSISVQVRLPNQAPTATITDPADGSTYFAGSSITFAGSATDPEDGTLAGASLRWSSSLDGHIGTGGSITRDDLSVGTHAITLTATDSDGASAFDSISVQIRLPNESPTVSITAPMDGVTLIQGTAVTLEGTATDPEDGTLTGDSLVWTSTLDGDIGSGESVTRDDLSVGIHLITLTATDSEGAFGYDSISIEFTSGVTVEWEKTFGGPDADSGYSVDQTTDGGYIITGSTSSFGAGGSDLYLVKVDSSGDFEWQATFGGPHTDSGRSVQQTSDGGYVVAGHRSGSDFGFFCDVYLVKTDALGNLEWEETFGPLLSLDIGYSVQQTHDGGYVVGGWVQPLESSDEGGFYLVKTDSSGNLEWERILGLTHLDRAASVEQTTDGGYVLAGETHSSLPALGAPDTYLVKTDASGDIEWTQRFGNELQDHGYAVQQTSDGGYIVAGNLLLESGSTLNSHSQVYLVKTDASGELEWEATFGGHDHEWGYSVQQTADDGYIAAGYTESFGAGQGDVYVVKAGPYGALEWQVAFGGSDWEDGRSVQQTTDGGYIVVGVTYSFGAGSGDVYVIKLAPED